VDSSSSTNGVGGDKVTLTRAAQSSSCGKGTAKTLIHSLKKSPSKSWQKRQILDGETLTRATRLDAERDLSIYMRSQRKNNRQV